MSNPAVLDPPAWVLEQDAWLESAQPVGPDEPDGDPWNDVESVLDASIDESLQLLLTVPPRQWSPGLRVLLAQLAGPDHCGRQLTSAQRFDYLAVLERESAHAAAGRVRLLAEIYRADSTAYTNRHGGAVAGFAHEEVACVLRMSPRSAQNQLKSAITLIRQLPATLAALAGGTLPASHAQAIVAASWTVPDAAVAEVESSVIRTAPQQTVAELHRSLRRAVLRADPSTGEERHQRAAEDRRVELVPGVDGMSELCVLLPAPQAAIIHLRLTAAAKLLPGDDPRTLDQQRADLFVDALLSGLPLGGLPMAQGVAPQIQVLVHASTLAGLDDQPADLAGYGAITAALARELARDPSGTWRRIVLDPCTGDLLDFGRHVYRPPPPLRDHATARDPVCVFPGCRQRSHSDQLDHIVPHRSDGTGGSTSPANLAPLCQRHHNAKTHHGWRYRRVADGRTTWTSPTGHTYLTQRDERWNRPANDAGVGDGDSDDGDSGDSDDGDSGDGDGCGGHQ